LRQIVESIRRGGQWTAEEDSKEDKKEEDMEDSGRDQLGTVEDGSGG
jgi:hypothetical protein